MSERTCSIEECDKDSRARGMCWAHYLWQYRGKVRFGVPGPTYPTETEQFWQRFKRQPNGCWEWTGHIALSTGYGVFGITQHLAHRWAYELLIGPIPEGLVIDHTCHNEDLTCPGAALCLHRRCVNPSHLEVVQRGENSRRGVTRATRIKAARV